MTKKPDHQRHAVKITSDAPAPTGSYSQAVKAAGLLFISGQGAQDARTGKEQGVVLDSAGNVIEYDISKQTHAALNNLQIVLKHAGCTLADLVEVNVFLKDINDFQEYNEVYSQYFSFAGPPARTTIQVAGLPGNSFIEIKAIAACPDQ